jgi:hypothetical protein
MSTGPTPTKMERLAEMFRRMDAAPAPATHDDAYRLLCETIDAVEDELTSTPNDPANWRTDGRIYPPQLDSQVSVPGRPDLLRYVSRGHDSFLADNGAITIALHNGTVVFDKPGADGRRTGWGNRP